MNSPQTPATSNEASVSSLGELSALVRSQLGEAAFAAAWAAGRALSAEQAIAAAGHQIAA